MARTSGSLLSAAIFFAVVCSAFGSRALLRSAKEVDTVEVGTERVLWIDPSAAPTATKGWNVIISMTLPGKYSTVSGIYLRQALSTLGFSTTPANMAFGGQNALAGFSYMVTYVVNVPAATTSAAAVASVSAVVTTSTLSSAAHGLVLKLVTFAAFQAR